MRNFTEKYHSANDTICLIDHSIHQMWFPVVYVFVFVVGFPANCLSLYYGYLQIKVKNELGIYLCNLTVADLLYIFSLPFWLQYVLQHDNWTYNELMCKICGVLLYENIYISIEFLCCISIDRYLAVVHPFRFHKLRTMKAAVIISAAIWTKEFLTSLLFFKHGEFTKDPESHVVCFEHYPIKSWEHTINYYRFFAGFLLPIFLLLFSYCCILRVVRKSHGTQLKKKLQIKQLVLSTVIIFLVCFGPYHVLVVVRSLFEKTCAFAAKIFNVYHFSLSLTSFNCIADPALYCFASESTYKDFIKLKNCCLRFSRCSKIETQESVEMNTPEILRSSGALAEKETDELNKHQLPHSVILHEQFYT
ncbi:G-protein coupled receptor 68 [Microcaecilia unicolor]|uniref:Ovarian cancer G-protein coupled receptor 1 n=1 Tax=Microcaecilia unicolor TaxID=1415580 RepID=A0A6P7Z2T4_9AMPH|nr:ovarian cancer G-protein coupled receptor 1 [Microcaecilia unicolor]XP_030071032.1 ovarian cancer G-protein coupled receptor 1 [Microcaecilia unicolor]